METFSNRRSGSAAFALVLTFTLSGSAGAQPVTISGSGTISHWVHFGNTIPVALETAFPAGAPFAATLSYDPSLVYLATNLNPTQVAHWGAVTRLSAWAAGHAISNTAAGGPAYVFDDDPQGGMLADAIQGDAPVAVDGSTTLAGLQVRGAVVSVFNTNGTPLSSLMLPGQLCLAEWQNLSLVLKVMDPAAGTLYQLATRGTPDRSIDSDGDGVSDGVELLHACISACAGDTDADGDALLDRTEITGAGTDPCSPDSDGDGVNDGIDPHPLVPGLSNDEIVELTRRTASNVLAVPEAAFAGPNANAERGRRNALSNRLHAAANAIGAGNLDEALSILEHLLDLLDGNPVPPDVMDEGPAKEAVREEVERLIALVRAG